ncbi:nuclear transport factor 2 family protein [Micromonospora psammae]|uniref:nuclear transport factor 2 family protein n=1 Tax=Micromonospora sp. CPCC 205556 TaxID=3122398 RepID=UPI002FF0238A
MSSDDVVARAERAYECFCQGLSTGRWQEFFGLLADEVEVLWPYPPTPGRYVGRDGRDKLVQFCGQLGGEGNRITEILSVRGTATEDGMVFEDHSRGEFFAQPYEGRHSIRLVMRGGQVVGFHEYLAPVS